MPGGSPEIVRCPPQLFAEALSLVLSGLAPSMRREIAGPLLGGEDSADLGNEPLFVLIENGRLRAAAWGQRQSGNIAVFWPPKFDGNADKQAAHRLADAVVRALDESRVELTQVLLEASDTEPVDVLRQARFRQLAELHYMSCERSRFPQQKPPTGDLEFVRYSGSLRSRLSTLIERTYEGTLDCAVLNGVRSVEDVINGYQGTGVFRPENWLIVRADHEDRGMLLLADHPKSRHWELMYMGLSRQARGRGWGGQITRYAQWLARQANVERIVTAVDAANTPAVAMYRKAGFELWDRRAVYVRFPGGK